VLVTILMVAPAFAGAALADPGGNGKGTGGGYASPRFFVGDLGYPRPTFLPPQYTAV
jgi:hypothetical protein